MNDHKYNQPEKKQYLSEPYWKCWGSTNKYQESWGNNHAGSVGSIIGKKGNKVWQLQTKNNVSITKTKQAEYNQKLTIERSIPNIQTTIDEIKQTTQCKCSKACAFGLILNLTMDILTS